MHALKSLNDFDLLENTARLVRQERELLTSILHHLREIESRRLFSGHGSLFEYAVKTLGYSEDQAWRRVSAMRLLNEMPELESDVANGKLNLTHLGMAQSLFKREKKLGLELTHELKSQVLTEIAGLSTRDAEKVVLSFATEPESRPDRISRVSFEKINLSFEVSENTKAKIDQLKNRFAHKDPNISLGELLDQICDIALKETDPARKGARRMNVESRQSAEVGLESAVTYVVAKPNRGAAESKSKPQQDVSQAEVRRQVWRRDEERCTCCGSRFALELDHIEPQARGGESTLENLRILCRSCNQRAAVKNLGLKKMDQHINKRTAAADPHAAPRLC